MNENITIVFDSDFGTDDAIAVSMWHFSEKKPDYIIATAGNTDLKTATKNAIILKKYYNLPSKIVMGIETNDVIKTEKDSFHGLDGLGNISSKFEKIVNLSNDDLNDYITFFEFQKELINCEKFDYISIGPITSLEELIKNSEIKSKINKAYLMGGGLKEFNGPNKTEFNFRKNPKAVRNVLNSDIEIVLATLDLTNFQRITEEEINKINKKEELIELLRFNMESNKNYNNINAAVIHDAMPVLYYIFPNEFKVSDKKISSDNNGAVFEDEKGRNIKFLESVTKNFLIDKLNEFINL